MMWKCHTNESTKRKKKFTSCKSNTKERKKNLISHWILCCCVCVWNEWFSKTEKERMKSKREHSFAGTSVSHSSKLLLHIIISFKIIRNFYVFYNRHIGADLKIRTLFISMN